MASSSSSSSSSSSYKQTTDEITRIYKSLPSRPSLEEISAAKSVIETLTAEQRTKLDELSVEVAGENTSPELFSVLKQVKKTQIQLETHERIKEANYLVELEKYFEKFDELIRRASEIINGENYDDNKSEFVVGEIERDDFGGKLGLAKSLSEEKTEISEGLIKCDFTKPIGLGKSLSGKTEINEGLVKISSTKPLIFSSGEKDKENLTLLQVAAIIENSAKTNTIVLNLRAKLMENIEWLPTSLGKLSNISELDFSENKIMALPTTIHTLKALTKLDLHSNQLINLPDSFGELSSLTHLDLHSNMLKNLPNSFANLKNLVDLDLGSNNFTRLPDLIGELSSLKRLNAETNELEEIPYTIGSCSSLVELNLDFNQIKALPEAIGKLNKLEIITLHYNRIGGLPTTMGNLANLRELDLSFNEIEAIPESFCFATKLVKLNVGNNFADLRALPRSIGNLELLEELDISDDQIKILPDSFKFLSNLRVFRADETPLEVPPREVIKQGAQAVVQYMADFVAKRNLKDQQPKKKKSFCSRICPLFCL